VKGTKTETSKKEGKESKSNRKYKRCMTEEVLEYLERERVQEKEK
jgi:hypothetical protein